MSLRAFGLGLSAAAAFSAVAVLEAPVQAATIEGKTLLFGGAAQLQNSNVGIGGISTLNFTPLASTSSNARISEGANELVGGFFGPDNLLFAISDLSLVKVADKTWELSGGSVSWLSGLGADTSIGFTLEAFDLVQNGGENFSAVISGFFTPSGVDGDGSLTSQGRFDLRGGSYSADITAIPTPALLPGLVGLGVAAFRKRNGQDNSEQEA
jgi:hypothetical protein